MNAALPIPEESCETNFSQHENNKEEAGISMEPVKFSKDNSEKQSQSSELSCCRTDDDLSLSDNEEKVAEVEEVEHMVSSDDVIVNTMHEALCIANDRMRNADNEEVKSEAICLVNLILVNIAAMYRDRHEYDKSVEYYKRAISMAKVRLSNDSHLDIGKIMVNMGRVYMRKNELELALKCFMDAAGQFQDDEPEGEIAMKAANPFKTNRHMDITMRLCRRVSLQLSQKMRAQKQNK